MGDLSELTLQTSYHKGRDDIARDFYLPCMRRACAYDRAVGYFRSSVFIIGWPALREFVDSGGKMRVLCSQVLADEDVNALESGYAARVDALLAARMLEEVRGLFQEEILAEPARVLAALVAQSTIDLQIAVMRESESRGTKGRIFHDKLGIFRDARGHRVMFKGSMNETWTGLAADGNLESIDVAATWMGSRDLERTKTEETYFEQLWRGHYPGVSTRAFPEVAKAEIQRMADPDWEASVSSLLEKERHTEEDPKGRTLRPHQATGLASWVANDRRGILAFATGCGKTFTALNAIQDAVWRRSEPVLVLVPDQLLFHQWYDELRTGMEGRGLRLLRAGAGYSRWKNALPLWTEGGQSPRVVLATVQTARTPAFRGGLRGGSHLTLVADEVHRLGSPANRELLIDGVFGARLGLSATPERAGDPVGTAAVLDFFGGVLEPRYTLSDAVRDGVLSQYFYRPHTVELSRVEADEWHSLTKQINQLYARAQVQGDGDETRTDRLKHLLIRRARVVKQAAGKVSLAGEVLTREFNLGQRWIVYCDDMQQLGAVSGCLTECGIQSMPFHSRMEGDRQETLRWLDVRGGVVVAIKCLDEGVDIPSVTHALILASSKNPREFVQRRGRVLRKAPGKALAYVHDAIVVPPRGRPEDSDPTDPITAGELARAVQFAQGASNPAGASDLQQIAIEAGIDWRTLIESGVEDEDD